MSATGRNGRKGMKVNVEPGAQARAEDAETRAADGELRVTLTLPAATAKIVRSLSVSGLYGRDIDDACMRMLEAGLRQVAVQFAAFVPRKG